VGVEARKKGDSPERRGTHSFVSRGDSGATERGEIKKGRQKTGGARNTDNIQGQKMEQKVLYRYVMRREELLYFKNKKKGGRRDVNAACKEVKAGQAIPIYFCKPRIRPRDVSECGGKVG